MSNIADIRKDYRLQTLDESGVQQHPIKQFDDWWAQAVDAQIEEVNAMTLATVDEQGIPNARIVLLKGYDEQGFVFFTNYESRKAQEIASTRKACLVFFWKELERQVRITGSIERINEAQNDEYFFSRPLGSQLGAWASPQSRIIPDRSFLESNLQEIEVRFSKEKIIRPPHWGGYRVIPDQIEFWQGRSSRLHDRIRYRKIDENQWKMERLAP
jgi:pyridoxamine 5'-phosphate oxidase